MRSVECANKCKAHFSSMIKTASCWEVLNDNSSLPFSALSSGRRQLVNSVVREVCKQRRTRCQTSSNIWQRYLNPHYILRSRSVERIQNTFCRCSSLSRLQTLIILVTHSFYHILYFSEETKKYRCKLDIQNNQDYIFTIYFILKCTTIYIATF